MRIVGRILSVVVALVGLALLIGGIYLAVLGGSWYYLLAGVAYLVAAALCWRYQATGAWWLVGIAVLTIPWGFWEVGADYWALFPRFVVPFALAGLGLLLLPSVAGTRRGWMRGLGVLALVGTGVFFGFAFVPHGVTSPPESFHFKSATAATDTRDWSAWAGTDKGLRDAPFAQINRKNVSQLQVAWVYHTGDVTPEGDEDTPLQIGDLVYTCTPHDDVAALDADTGKPRWTFDPHAKAPFWNRCRGLGSWRDPDTTDGDPCHQRIVIGTVDARLIEVDAETGKPCAGFGQAGSVDLTQGMGKVTPGFYFQTAAPLVAGDKIVVGGWVLDNQKRGEPSGVIRAYDARTGKLAWSWDLAKPERNGQPPVGETYTRGTPNMWTSAAYDPQLGLVYIPLGNATPDYFGMGRPPGSDEYTDALVALDVETGRERWHFQTVHHDIWDYDLPSQPALVDLPDGNGGTIPAVLQTTKRGQLFLLNRQTGKPLTKVVEKPVPQEGAVPEENLSATQPYSVGMPTIGDLHLTEKTMWGMTMFDQLYCRIKFDKLRYAGDFTPIGLDPAIHQPSNLGGLNWGSVSVDTTNDIAYVNDIRIPGLFQLVPRKEYNNAHSASNGHGPSPQFGTPYGLELGIWMSPLGVPCVQPPFGTLSAVDLDTHKLLWQVPAGTAEQLGPGGIKLGLPMRMGMPTYAGTLTTAGGLVFFAGFQDFYLRAYDAATGKKLWQHALPVGSSATPMTYVSPRTGKQYVVISAGGAGQSSEIGDYVIAFALPDGKSRR